VDFPKQQIFVRRTWLSGRVGLPKSKASKAPVPMHPLLAGFMQDWHQTTPYSQPRDWVFASTRKKGKQPRSSSVMVEDYVRPAAIKVGILTAEDQRRFGFHNLRHWLIFSRQCRHKSESGSGFTPTQRCPHDAPTLQPERKRRSACGSGHHARRNGCSTGVGKLKNGLATGYAKEAQVRV
jgi:integrase